ncbi:ATPase (AAA+ superfamily) [mine drainage metagenome]|uniref:ATPase (AAA+ superfamily) n=1 Tax=mine drainage metagenome TaxID=410659 RepID=T0ZGZ2_9ZZZZ
MRGRLLGGITAGAKLMTIAPTAARSRDSTLLGQLFEALVTLSVRVYAQAAESHVYHCRTYDGRREIDLIVETADHRVLALEVKTSAEVTDEDVNHLLWLREQLGSTLTDMAVITTGTHAYRRQDGVAVIPAALLGP